MTSVRFGVVALLVGVSIATLPSDGQTDQSATNAVPTVPAPAYADSTNGLHAQFADIVNAARSRDEAALTAAIDSLRIPNADQWIAARFEPRLVPQLVLDYAQGASAFQSHVRWVMENFAKFDDFALQVSPFGTAEPRVPPGFKWLLRRPVAPIDARNCRFTPAARDPKQGPPSWVSSFVYADGRFRFAGGTYPFWTENSVVPEQSSPTLPTVTSFECPKYPPEAKAAGLAGMVRLQITTDGHRITDVKVQGHPLIAPAASQNVRTWKFADHQPMRLNVTYLYVFKRDPTTKCSAKMELPTGVTVSAGLR